MQSLAQARWIRTRAVELAIEGRSYDEIAREVGFSHRGSAHRAVYKALREREIHAVDDLRQVELDRLDALQSAIWEGAVNGDTTAAQVVLRIIDQRIRLLGLEQRRTEVANGSPYEYPNCLVVGHPEGNPGEATNLPRADPRSKAWVRR